MSKPFGEGTAKVTDSRGLGIAGVSGSSNHESAVGALVAHVEEHLRGYLTTRSGRETQDYFSLVG